MKYISIRECGFQYSTPACEIGRRLDIYGARKQSLNLVGNWKMRNGCCYLDCHCRINAIADYDIVKWLNCSRLTGGRLGIYLRCCRSIKSVYRIREWEKIKERFVFDGYCGSNSIFWWALQLFITRGTPSGSRKIMQR